MRNYHMLLLCAAAILTASCAKNEKDTSGKSLPGSGLRFSASMKAYPEATKTSVKKAILPSTPMREGDLNMGFELSVEESPWEVSEATKTALTTAMPNEFNVKAVFSDGTTSSFSVSSHGGSEYYINSSSYSSSQRWNQPDKTVRFYAWYPELHSNNISSTLPPSFNINLATSLGPSGNTSNTAGAYYDVIESRSDEYPGDYNDFVPLEFEHAFSAIQFKTGNNLFDMTINSIYIVGLHRYFTKEIGNGSWAYVDDDTHSFQLFNLNLDITGAANQTIYGGDNAVCIIPETAPEGSYIQMNTTIDSKSYTFKVDLSNFVFEKGKKYIFSLSLPENEWMYEFDARLIYTYEASHGYSKTIPLSDGLSVSKPSDAARGYPDYMLVHSRKVSRSGIVRKVAWDIVSPDNTQRSTSYNFGAANSKVGVTTAVGWNINYSTNVPADAASKGLEYVSIGVTHVTNALVYKKILQAESGRSIEFYFPCW